MSHDFIIADSGYAIRQFMQLYKKPLQALKEYPSNSIDEGADKVSIFVNKNDRSIVIQDNGTGMSPEQLERMPVNIAYSAKRGLGKIGEKALGILAFGSFADRCNYFSRNPETGEYSNLWMQGEPPKWEVKTIERGKLPYGEFERGTQVVIHGVSDELFERYFQPAKIREMLSETYSPRLRKGDLRMLVGYQGRRDSWEEVPPLAHRGHVELDKVVETEHGNIDLLLFVYPKGTTEKVRTYNKGVLVLPSVTELDEFSEPWNSGKLSGEINESFNTLNPQRDGYVRSKRFGLFVQEVRNYEDRLRESIKDTNLQNRRSYLDEFADKLLKALDKSFTQLSRNFGKSKTIGTSDDPIETVVPVSELVSTHVPGDGDGEGSGSGSHEHKRTGVKGNEDGAKKHVRGAKRRISEFYRVNFEHFDTEHQSKRSFAAENMGVIHINIGHSDYESESKGKDKNRELRYVTQLTTKELALLEYKRLCKQRKLDPQEDIDKLGDMQLELYLSGVRSMGI